VDEKDTVVVRPVQVGARQSDGLRVVTAGLKANEWVVVNGLQRARPGALVKPEAGPMLPPQPTAEAPGTQPVSSGH
jgi:multidrug efflux system membrane fusion protein